MLDKLSCPAFCAHQRSALPDVAQYNAATLHFYLENCIKWPKNLEKKSSLESFFFVYCTYEKYDKWLDISEGYVRAIVGYLFLNLLLLQI